MNQQQIEHLSFIVTMAMPFVLGGVHMAHAFTKARYEKALASPDPDDDATAERWYRRAEMLDSFVTFIVTMTSGGLNRVTPVDQMNRTPGIERVENPEDDDGNR